MCNKEYENITNTIDCIRICCYKNEKKSRKTCTQTIWCAANHL